MPADSIGVVGDGGSGAGSDLLPKEFLDHRVPIQKDGKTEHRKISEVLALAQKGEVAEKRFHEASELAKTGELGIAVQKMLSEGLRDQDLDKLRRGLAMSGATEDQLETIFGPANDNNGRSRQPSKKPVSKKPARKVDPEDEDDDDELEDRYADDGNSELAARLERTEEVLKSLLKRDQEVEEAQKKSRAERRVDSVVDADEVLAGILKSVSDDPDAVRLIRRLSYDQIGEAAERMPMERAMPAGIEKLKKVLSKIGVGKTQRSESNDDRDDDGPTGGYPTASRNGDQPAARLRGLSREAQDVASGYPNREGKGQSVYVPGYTQKLLGRIAKAFKAREGQ